MNKSTFDLRDLIDDESSENSSHQTPVFQDDEPNEKKPKKPESWKDDTSSDRPKRSVRIYSTSSDSDDTLPPEEYNAADEYIASEEYSESEETRKWKEYSRREGVKDLLDSDAASYEIDDACDYMEDRYSDDE